MSNPSTDHDSIAALPVIEMAMSFYQSRVLMSALELDVFGALADGPLARPALEERVGLHSRVSEDFLDALVALGLLARGESGYANSELADRFLVKGRDTYVGGFAEMGGASLYPLWMKLTDLLRTGEPQIPPGGNFFQGLYQRPEAARKFMDAMDTFNDEIAAKLSAAADWSGFERLVDVGGARGDLSVRLVERHPGLSAVCFDLPQIEPLFKERVADSGVEDRVTLHGGDFVTDELPPADVYVFGHILHGRDLDQRQGLVNRAYAGLRPGGCLFVFDRMIDDARNERHLSLLGSLGMALVSKIGSEYTPGTCRSWLDAAGFETVSVEPLGATDTLVVARKPA
ncbi:methyltransferase [Streptomyces sp. NPDC005438]|uniref:methyltransferase n=1 Tax=Streptomyces sp. NPDC005438 TaxID=3156880 RepID=UPI0033BF78D2